MQLLGPTAYASLIKNSLFAFVIGSNDYLNNYLTIGSPSPRLYTPQQFHVLVINTYRQQLIVSILDYLLPTRNFPSCLNFEHTEPYHIIMPFPLVCLPYSRHLTLIFGEDGQWKCRNFLIRYWCSYPMTSLELVVQTLLNLGVRKFLLSNVGALGCIPYRMTYQATPTDQCVASDNVLVSGFNTLLRGLVDELNSKYPYAKFILSDSYVVIEDFVTNPGSYGKSIPDTLRKNSATVSCALFHWLIECAAFLRRGAIRFKLLSNQEAIVLLIVIVVCCCHAGFIYKDVACCGIPVGRYHGLTPCLPNVPYCPDRRDYVFWDPYHPSDAANVIIGNRFFDGTLRDVYPMNIRALLSLKLPWAWNRGQASLLILSGFSRSSYLSKSS